MLMSTPPIECFCGVLTSGDYIYWSKKISLRKNTWQVSSFRYVQINENKIHLFTCCHESTDIIYAQESGPYVSYSVKRQVKH